MKNAESLKNDEARMPSRALAFSADGLEDAFWGDDETSPTLELREDDVARVFDLEERTSRFGEAIVQFAKLIPRNPVNDRLIDQLIGCGTAVGANYCEADDGFPKKTSGALPNILLDLKKKLMNPGISKWVFRLGGRVPEQSGNRCVIRNSTFLRH